MSGEVGPDDCTDGQTFSETWTLDIDAPGTIDISLNTGPLGGSFEVWSQDCSRAFAFSEGGPANKRALVRLDPGSYGIVVSAGFDPGGPPGAYTLRARELDCGACAPAGVLACEERGIIEGTLGPGDCADADGFLRDVFTFETPVLRELFLGSAPDFGSSLWILREDRVPRLAFAAGAAVGLLVEAGKYTFVVAGPAPDTGGDYSFQFSCKTTPLCSEACVAGTLECGKPVAGTLAENDCSVFTSFFDAWRFDVPAGSEAEISVLDPAGSGFLSYSFFRSDCAAFPPFEEVCDFPADGPAACRLEEGTYTLIVEVPNFVVLQLGEQPYEVMVTTSACREGGRRLPGDCDQNAALDPGDILCLLGYLFRREPAPLECGSAPGELGAGGRSLLDWDASGRLDVVDAVRGLLHLFGGGLPHALGTECVEAAGCSSACGG